MKFKKIVGFGDSWMYGHELTEPNITAVDVHEIGLQHTRYREHNCFLGQLGQHYQVPTENFGIMGGSLQSAIWTLLWWLEHEPDPGSCLVLHGITNSYRFSYYNPNHVVMLNDPPWHRFIHSSRVLSPEFEPLCKKQIALTACDELHKLTHQQAVLTFDGIAARQKIELYQFNIFPSEAYGIQFYNKNIPNTPTLICPELALKDWVTDLKPKGHPDETGHKKIAQLLINYIDPAIIVA